MQICYGKHLSAGHQKVPSSNLSLFTVYVCQINLVFHIKPQFAYWTLAPKQLFYL